MVERVLLHKRSGRGEKSFNPEENTFFFLNINNMVKLIHLIKISGA